MSKWNLRKTGLVGSAVMVIALPFTANHEGEMLKAYLDPVGIPTICFGETKNVQLGDEKTSEECHEMLAARLGWFAFMVDHYVQPDMHPKTHAALASFAYNVGIGAFKRSTLLKKLNAGDEVGACNELSRWVYAGGRKFRGLVRRRAEERSLCLEGVSDKMTPDTGETT